MNLQLIVLELLLPLTAFCFAVFSPTPLRRFSREVSVLCAGAAFGIQVLIFRLVLQTGGEEILFSWISSTGDGPGFSFGFLLDPLNTLMLTVVTAVTFFVQIFSVFYMEKERDTPRYFAFLSLFSCVMMGLVASANLLQTFMFWELVGLASYLLIGFWFERPAAANAARKAFVLNRLADLGFLAGLIILYLNTGTLRISELSAEALATALAPGLLTIVALLLLTGVAGKSAQFPFHVWLPDAMEGPTPISALIHSATMVAAGVFLLVRMFPLFEASTTALTITILLGGLTAILAATLATVERDIKRVLAYSTVSQLGLMVMSIGASSPDAAMFHLVTHAFFKSLLFLTAGGFIHAFGTNDLFEIGRRGGKSQRLLVVMLGIGLLSLCGIPPLGGFFSKDTVLLALLERGLPFYLCGLSVTVLTAFYAFRIIFIVLFTPTDHLDHPHPTSFALRICESVPLISLAALSVAAGIIGATQLDEHLRLDVLLPAQLAIALGALTAWRMRRQGHKSGVGSSGISALLKNKYYVDDAFAFVTQRVVLPLAAILRQFDNTVINGIFVDKTARSIGKAGSGFSRLQNGLLQNYLMITVVAVVWVLIYFAVTP